MTIEIPQGERGSVIILVFTLVLLVLEFSALVIDLTRADYATHGIQRSVDAASLAAATQLVLSSNSDLDRWKNSKRAILAVVKQNPIFARYAFPDLTDSSYHQGATDNCESSGIYRSQIYDNGEIRVELERGTYVDDGGGTFTSLESSTTCNASAAPLLPNAARVTITIFNFPNVFGTVPPFNFPAFRALSRTAVGAQID